MPPLPGSIMPSQRNLARREHTPGTQNIPTAILTESRQRQILELKAQRHLARLRRNLPCELQRLADAAAARGFFLELEHERRFVPFAAHAESFREDEFVVAIDQAQR